MTGILFWIKIVLVFVGNSVVFINNNYSDEPRTIEVPSPHRGGPSGEIKPEKLKEVAKIIRTTVRQDGYLSRDDIKKLLVASLDILPTNDVIGEEREWVISYSGLPGHPSVSMSASLVPKGGNAVRDKDLEIVLMYELDPPQIASGEFFLGYPVRRADFGYTLVIENFSIQIRSYAEEFMGMEKIEEVVRRMRLDVIENLAEAIDL
jgi:hypothetical protein